MFSINAQLRFASVVVDGVRASLRTTDANLDCAFVENALFYTDP